MKSGEISIEHCPTKEMIGDYFTKPLAGALFRKFRDLILGIRSCDMGKYWKAYRASSKARREKELAILNNKGQSATDK